MKKVFLLATVLAACLFSMTSCSSTEDAVDSGDVLSKFDKDGKAYLAIKINTPTESGNSAARTRAAGYTPTVGSTEENAINEAILVIFSGANEQTSSVKAAYQMTLLDTETLPGEVDERHVATVSISSASMSSTDHLYAYVILNAHGQYRVSSDNKLLPATGTTPITDTFTDFIKRELDYTTIDADPTNYGILMTTTPLSKKPGSNSSPAPDGTLWYMPEITASDIYRTIDEAKNSDSPLDVFVERVAAKVNVNVSVTATSASTPISFTNACWQVDNLAKTYYTTRPFASPNTIFALQADGISFYRFVGDTKVNEEGNATGGGTPSYTFNTNTPESYRISWAEGTNYGKGTWDIRNNLVKTTPSGKSLSGNASGTSTFNPTTDFITAGTTAFAYIPENTLDADQMRQSCTTRVIVALQFNGGKSFYTSSLEGNDVIYDKASKASDLKTLIEGKLNALPAAGALSGTISVAFGAVSNGFVPLTVSSTNTSDDVAPLQSYLNDNIYVREYIDGWAYYKVMIRHFESGSEVKAPVTSEGPAYDKVYPKNTSGNRDADYLGSYSVVRNHWYDINVTEVKHIGLPVVPEIPAPVDPSDTGSDPEDDTPDDEVESYLSFKISVMKWAKKSHSIVL